MQLVAGTALVAGGNQIVQTAAQGIVLCYGQVCQLQKTGSGKHAAFHTQKRGATVCGIQLGDIDAGGGLIGAEFTEDQAALGVPFDGDIPAVPVQVDAACHGSAGPWSVTLFVGKLCLGGSGLGVHAVKHVDKEGTPCALAPFVGGLNDVQSRLERQCFVFQLAEGGGHGIDLHGKTTSCPSRIWREIFAASLMWR